MLRTVLLTSMFCAQAAGGKPGASPAASSDPFASYSDNTRNARSAVADDLDGPSEEVRYLKQGWSPAESMRFYSLPQGSKLIPYLWFISLEHPTKKELFASPENMNRYRYLPQQPDPKFNPDGLPVGFVREPKQAGDPLNTDWLGLTCAACHTAEIRVNKIAYRIDGGPTMADHDTFIIELTAAMKATIDDGEKFDRFAAKVLGANPAPSAKGELLDEFKFIFKRRSEYNERNKTDVAYGFARLDAFGRIVNETLVRHIHGDYGNEKIPSPNAPVSYPFLWGITKHDRVQWNGIAQNTKLIGPLGRNVGEVLGVFGEVTVPRPLPFFPDIDIREFKSSVRFGNLIRLEDTVAKLTAPKWEDVFGKLDAEKVAAGKVLFAKHCLQCHDPNDKVGDFVKTNRTKINDGLGTDPAMATNFALRKGKSGNMRRRFKTEGNLPSVFREDGEYADSLLLGVVARTIAAADPFEFRERAKLSKLLEDVSVLKIEARLAMATALAKLSTEQFLSPTDDRGDLLVYRGRPLEGIWATAPYLHNGSVPNLEELLLPASKRSKTFKVGSREFDAVNVGFRTDRGFLFDTTIDGNRNSGHDTYGRADLDDPQKRAALLEYLKSL